MKKILRRRFLSFLLLLSLTLQGPAIVWQKLPPAVAAENAKSHSALVAEMEQQLSALDNEYRSQRISLDDPRAMQTYTDRRNAIINHYKKKDTRSADFANFVTKPHKDGSYDITKEYLSSGSDPKSLASDMDISAIKDGGAKKLADRMNNSGKGYHFIKDPNNSHRYIDTNYNIVIWEKPPDYKVGSPKWKAWVSSAGMANDTFSTAGGLYKTSNGKMGINDPQGAVLDNLKKASEAVSKKSTTLNDGKTIAKSVMKALKWSNTDINPNFKKTCKTLQQGGSWEQARVTDFTDPPRCQEQQDCRIHQEAMLRVFSAFSIER